MSGIGTSHRYRNVRFGPLLKPQRHPVSFGQTASCPDAAPVRLVAGNLGERLERRISRASVNRLTNAPIIARRGCVSRLYEDYTLDAAPRSTEPSCASPEWHRPQMRAPGCRPPSYLADR